MRANYRALFPQLPDQSPFHRRAQALRLLVEARRRVWRHQLAVTAETPFLLDTKPNPVVGSKRSKRRSACAGSANDSACVSRTMHYFGSTLVRMTTFYGLPAVDAFVPAHTDERAAAETVLGSLAGCTILADTGFISPSWHMQIVAQTGHQIGTVKRRNQQQQNPKAVDRWLNSVREWIKGAFNAMHNTGRHSERLLAKTVVGVSTRVIATMTSHALKHLLRHCFGIDVQTFEVASA